MREALGYKPYHFPLRDHYATDQWMYGDAHDRLTESGDWREKIELTTHRYMREDVAYGLAFLVSVAEWAGVPCPVARGLLALGSAVCSTDFRNGPRTLESLGLATLDRAAMRPTAGRGTVTLPVIASLGAGRMGRGIAHAFAYAGHEVLLVDLKDRARGCCAQARGRGADRGGRKPRDARLARRVRRRCAAGHPRAHPLRPEKRSAGGARSRRRRVRGRPRGARREARRLRVGVRACSRRRDRRLDHVDDALHAARRLRHAPRALSECPLAQPGVPGAARRAEPASRHGPGDRRAHEGDCSRRSARCRWSAPPRPASSRRACRR